MVGIHYLVSVTSGTPEIDELQHSMEGYVYKETAVGSAIDMVLGCTLEDGTRSRGKTIRVIQWRNGIRTVIFEALGL